MAFDGALRVLYIREVGGSYLPIGCLTSNGIQESIDALPTTTRLDQGWKTFRPTIQQYTIPFAGLQEVSVGGSTIISYDWLKTLKRSRTLIEWKLEGVGIAAPLEVDTGRGYITELAEEAPVGDNLSFNGLITGSGNPIQFAGGDPPSVPSLSPPLTTDPNVTGEPIDRVVLNWSASTDDFAVAGYRVYITSSDGSSRVVDVGNQTTYIDTGVIQGNTYNYNITAYDFDGNESSQSNLRTVTITTPSDPAIQEEGILFQDDIQILDQTDTAMRDQTGFVPAEP